MNLITQVRPRLQVPARFLCRIATQCSLAATLATIGVFVLLCALVDSTSTPSLAAETTELNPETITYDDHPSISVGEHEATWVAWHTYANGTDGIAVRKIPREGRIGPLSTFSEPGSTYGPPTIVADSADQAWVVWPRKKAGRWHVMLRQWHQGRWLERRQLSDSDHDAIFPTAGLVRQGSLVVAWSERVENRFRIRGCRVDADREPRTFDISGGIDNAYRPVLARHGTQLWAFWDEYRQPNYSVHGRRLLPNLGERERVSPVDEYCLTPTALSHETGLHVAWLRKIDVMGGPRVISQWHSLHGAVRRDDEWIQISDAQGNSAAAELTQGLMAKITPRPVATGGYLGSRVRPMLHACDDRVWLLWERKSDHRGSTPKVSGDLVGRPLRNGVWQTPQVLQRGYVDYHLVPGNAPKRTSPQGPSSLRGERSCGLIVEQLSQLFYGTVLAKRAKQLGQLFYNDSARNELQSRDLRAARPREGRVRGRKTELNFAALPRFGNDQRRLEVVASRLPQAGKRTYERLETDLAEAQPFAQETWSGWRPIKLPIEAERTSRREVAIAGTTYQLFWADLHCHSNLSADAEGETDELNCYARDRAGIDVVVFTNNDFYNVPLTQYEYELGNLFAASHSVEGEFLSLPGYEWTSRIPGVATASLGDPGNWLPPYRNRSFPNHRSVIYPTAGGPLVHFTEVGNDIAKLNDAVDHAGGITLSQHPAFQPSGHAVEVGLELTSGWSNYIAQNPRLFHRALNQGLRPHGRRLGFVANGDSHRRAPGLSGALTGIYAEELTPAAILAALRARRCFATSGSRIFLDARAGDAFMGAAASASQGSITLTLRASGTRAITSATLVRDGAEIYQANGTGQQDLSAEFTDNDLAPGLHWYYWRISQDVTAPVLPGNLMTAHGHLAWSSPHWVVVK